MKINALAVGLAITLALAMAACTNLPVSRWPKPLKTYDNATPVTANPAPAPRSAPPSTRIERTPTPDMAQMPRVVGAGTPARLPAKKGELANLTLTFDQEKLPTIVQLVYGTILKKNYSIDPRVAERTDLVTLRAGPQTPSQVEQTVRLLLQSYGVAVIQTGNGMYRIVPSADVRSFTPEIRRGRSLPETPSSLRPLFQMVELQSVSPADVASWIGVVFGEKVTVQPDPMRNAIMLSGQVDDVRAAMEAINLLDQPAMKGRYSARINPVYISADQLATSLGDVMRAEGYSASVDGKVGAPVSLIPIKAVNAIIAFAADQQLLAHVLDWAKQLDHPSQTNVESGFYTYQAQNTEAQKLADTLREMLNLPGQSPLNQSAPLNVPGAGQAPSNSATSQAVAAAAKKIVVNAPNNTIIFKGSSEEFSQVLKVLQDLDKPTKAAIIEVTVAQVDLSDSLELGVELSSDMLKEGAFAALTGGAGLTVKYFKPGSTAATDAVKALASQNRAQILSSPRVMARNGETATIQVGQQVPIVTQNLGSAATSIPGTGNLLTSVQYKDVGVILKVKPIIYSGDRIELEVSQEVSDAKKTTTGVENSPTIDTKKVETRLALKDGSTVMLGGLISNKDNAGNSGVPLLKDLPIIGNLFGVSSESGSRQELIMLITPYTVVDDYDAKSITDAFRRQLGPWADPNSHYQFSSPGW